MADAAVTQAIYALGLDPSAYAQASQKVVQANEQIVNSTEQVTVSEEKVTKATTTRASSLDRIRARYDDAFKAQQQYEREVQAVNKAEAAGVGSIQQRSAALNAATKNYESTILRLTAANGNAAAATERGLSAVSNGITINRIGLMELQAAGINSFQALAAGMDPFRVATMEGAQVVGALVQGGVLGFKTMLGSLAPLTAAVGLAAIGWKLWGRALDDASPAERMAEENQKKITEATNDGAAALKLYGELQKNINDVLLTSAENADRVAAAKRGETRALAENTLEVVKNRTAHLTPDLIRAQGRLSDLQSRPDASSSAVARDIATAQEEVSRLMKGLADLRQMADDANDALDRMSDPKNWGKARDETQKANDSLEKYIRGLENAAQAAGQSVEQNKVTAALLDAQEKLIDSQGKKLRDLTEPEKQRIENAVRLKNELEEQSKIIQKQFQDDVRAEQTRLKKDDEVERDIQKMEELARASGKSTEETRVQAAIIAEQNKLYDEQGHKIRDLTDAEKDRIRNAVELKDKNDKLRKDLEHAIKTGTDRATSFAADTLYDAFTGKIKSVGEFLKTTLLRAAADVAAQMIFRPLIQPVMASAVAGLPSLFGLGGGMAGAMPGSAGGGMNLLGTGSNLLSLGQGAGLFGGAGLGISSAIDSFGASIGFGGVEAAAPSAAFVGPMPATSGLLGTTSLSQFLGGAGMGFAAGSLLNSLVGGNQVGGTIGSGAGALAGAIIGSIVPGIGTLIGGLIGGAGGGLLGGLFGPGKSVGPNGVTYLGTANGRLTVGASGADNGADANVTAQAAQQLAQALNTLADTYKLTLNNNFGGIYTNGIYQGSAPGGGGSGGPTSAQAFISNLISYGGITSSDPHVQAAIRASTADTLEQNLQAVLALEAALDPQPVDAVAQGLKAINDQFDGMKDKALQFGFTLDQVEAARQKAIDAYNIGLRSPYYQAAGGIVDFLNAQALNDNSTLNPNDRLTLAQQQFGQLLDRVRGGDVSATGSLTQAASNLLTIGRQNFASSVSFANLESNVRSSLLSVADTFTNDDSVDRMIAATAQQTSVQQAGFDNVVKAIGELKRQIALLSQKVAA